jgi:hypothetical protein
VRSTWDYTLRREEFLDWAAACPRLANPPRCCLEHRQALPRRAGAAGVPVVPTTFVAPGEALEVPAYEHVVKPTVARARATPALRRGEDSSAHARRCWRRAAR